jgi:hypothetical protein
MIFISVVKFELFRMLGFVFFFGEISPFRSIQFAILQNLRVARFKR